MKSSQKNNKNSKWINDLEKHLEDKERYNERTGKIKKKKGKIITISIIALLLSWTPYLSNLFIVLGLALLLPIIFNSIKTKSLPSNSGNFITAIIILIFAIYFHSITFIEMRNFIYGDPSEKEEKVEKKEKYKGKLLKEIDVNGLTIKEACEKVRAEGWKVEEVAGDDDYSEKSDCSDNNKKVAKYYYYNLDEDIWTPGSVNFRFNNKAKKKTDNINTETSTKNNSKSSSKIKPISKTKDGDVELLSYQCKTGYYDILLKIKNNSSKDITYMFRPFDFFGVLSDGVLVKINATTEIPSNSITEIGGYASNHKCQDFKKIIIKKDD